MSRRKFAAIACAAALAGTVALAAVAAGPAAAQTNSAGLAGTWRGSYTCAQGLTALTLVITGAGENLAARFEFSAHPSNPGVPSGSFTLAGRFEAKTGEITLTPVSWIDRPPDYQMVPLSGRVRDGGRAIAGRVLTEGCSSFSVERAAK